MTQGLQSQAIRRQMEGLYGKEAVDNLLNIFDSLKPEVEVIVKKTTSAIKEKVPCVDATYDDILLIISTITKEALLDIEHAQKIDALKHEIEQIQTQC